MLLVRFSDVCRRIWSYPLLGSLAAILGCFVATLRCQIYKGTHICLQISTPLMQLKIWFIAPVLWNNPLFLKSPWFFLPSDRRSLIFLIYLGTSVLVFVKFGRIVQNCPPFHSQQS